MPVWSHYLKLMGLNGDVNLRLLVQRVFCIITDRMLLFRRVSCGVMMYVHLDGKYQRQIHGTLLPALTWQREYASKPRYKCGDCSHRQCDSCIRISSSYHHLAGTRLAGGIRCWKMIPVIFWQLMFDELNGRRSSAS